MNHSNQEQTETSAMKTGPKKTTDALQPNHWGAYVNADIRLPANQAGSLSGLTFAVKDVFNIQGETSGAGNPDWLRTHDPATSTAPALLTLLENGAILEGSTQTDELMYSLNGENAHYGTPTNPLASDRIPGGSSSGSAVAAAAGLVDFAIGTDTGGSVRIPSSYCGLYGFRPTHGAVSTEGVIPLAHSFDTVGWMSQDVTILRNVGNALLKKKLLLKENGSEITTELDTKPFTQFFIATEAWELPEAEDCSLLLSTLHGIEGWQPEGYQCINLTEPGESLADWSAAFRVLQGLEIAHEHSDWLTKERPTFGPGIAERFEWACSLEKSASEAEVKLRARVRRNLVDLLGEEGLLAIPTAPGPAPLLGLKGPEAEAYRAKTMQLSCIAGLSGLPQVTVPVHRLDGLPLGLSFIGGTNTDLRLLHWTAKQFAEEVCR
ncbi:amidase [Paenibacillus polysaccharolyticus]|uniref:Amidase n=2 Tax=Paenibacillus polysaccharolyticus TaxID=582692 RepID=A0A1G5K6V7_9BACL|nr:amidase [Paenibacillus polysaccharolyticus]